MLRNRETIVLQQAATEKPQKCYQNISQRKTNSWGKDVKNTIFFYLKTYNWMFIICNNHYVLVVF